MKVPRYLPYLLILPACALLFLFKLYPLIYTVLESVFVKNEFTFRIYNTLLKDKVFWNSLWITIKLSIVIIPVQVTISVVLALLANTTVKGIGVFRTIFFLPFTVSSAVACVVWSLMFAPNNGVINSLLGLLNIPAQKFFLDPKQALWCIVMEASWVGCGYWMMFILAGLKNIDESIYESARIDGAGFFTRLFKITLPLIKKVMLFVVVANSTANILMFTPMKLITNGGPLYSTNTLMYEAYKSAFVYSARARSAAIVTILIVIVSMVCALQFFLMRDQQEKAPRGKKA